MDKTFYFRCHAGPTAVRETVHRLRHAGIDAHVETAHAYGTVKAKGIEGAVSKLNDVAGYTLCDRRTGDELREFAHG